MKLTSFIFALGMGALLLSSCSKEQVVFPEDNDPVFRVDGTIAGETIELVAGDDGAFMHTSTKIENGVRLFSGNLSNGETSLEIGVFDGNLDLPNHTPEIDLATTVLNFAKRSNEPLAVLTKDLLNQNQNIAAIEWYVNGSPTYSEEVSIMEPGKYDICAVVTYVGSGVTEQLCDQIIIGYARHANFYINCSVDLNNIGANLVSTGANIESVAWFLDGEPFGTNASSLQQTIDSSSHILKARVTFANGVVREKSCRINGGVPFHYIPDFSIFEITSGNGFPNQDYHIKLKVEHGGKVYESVEADNESSSISLLNLEYFGENAAGNDVYKALVQIQAIVMDMSTEKLIPLNLTATMGIEVP